MSRQLFFDEREFLLDETIFLAEKYEKEQKEWQEIEERERSFERRGIRIFRSNNRFKNRQGKKHIFFPHYPKEFLPL